MRSQPIIGSASEDNAGPWGTGDIVDGSITGADIADGTITAADITPEAVLVAIKRVDGAGSGLDADTLDGASSASFVRKAGDTMTGALVVPASTGGISLGPNSGASGAIRMPNGQAIMWRNATDTATGGYVSYSASEQLVFSSTAAAYVLAPALVVGASGEPSTVEKLRVAAPITADVTANVMFAATATTAKPLVVQGQAAQTANLFEAQTSTGAVAFSVGPAGTVTVADAANVAFNTTTGTKLGTAANQKHSHWGATPIVQPTTAVAGATFVAGAGTTVNDASTFDGYTMRQVVRALRNMGALA